MLNDRVEPPDHALYSVELSFCYAEAAANILTNSALDPESKIPEYKYAAVRIERAGPGDGSAESRAAITASDRRRSAQ